MHLRLYTNKEVVNQRSRVLTIYMGSLEILFANYRIAFGADTKSYKYSVNTFPICDSPL